MAITFFREATDGGDFGVWGPYEQNQNRINIGLISCRLYKDGADLKIESGRIGLDNGSSKGVCVVDTNTTIDFSGVAASNWAKIEIANTGSTGNITATDISGATDYKTLPTDFTNAYDGDKGGFYIASAKRCIGIVWVNAGGNLEGIINVLSSTNGYIGYSLSDDANDYRHQFFKAGDYEPYKLFCAKREITADTTVSASVKRQELICKTNDLRVSLPALSTVDEFELTIFNASGAMVHIDPNAAETVNGIANLFSKQEGDIIRLEKYDGKWRVTNGWLPYLDSGHINRSDWTDTHIGFTTITYNTLVGNFRLGEKVTGANGSYGWVIYDNGSTTLVLVWVVCVGVNIFNNTEVITGSISGATAAVNMASGLKNVSSNVYHGWANIIEKIYKNIYISTDKAEANKYQVYPTLFSGAGVSQGIQDHGVDTNNFKFQSAANYVPYLNDSGVANGWDNQDYYYRIFIKLLIW